MARKAWLVKSEPHKYSWDDLVAEGQSPWDGVRNYQARNNMMAMSVGDLVLYYHSVKGKEIVGLAEVIKEHQQDPTTDDDRWRCVTIAPVGPAKTPLTLAAIKTDPALADIALVKQSRLSVMPIADAHFKRILKLTGLKAPAKKATKKPATKKPAAKKMAVKKPAAAKKTGAALPEAWLVYAAPPNPSWSELRGSVARTWTVGEDKRARRSLRAMGRWDLVFIAQPARGRSKSKISGLAQVSRVNDREASDGEPRVLLSPLVLPKKTPSADALSGSASLNDLAPIVEGEAAIKRVQKNQIEDLLRLTGLKLPIKRKPLLTGPWPEDIEAKKSAAKKKSATKKTKGAKKKPASKSAGRK